jgi:CBS domain-containing protein
MMSAVVKDVMSTHPVSVSKDASFKELAAKLFELGVSGFPVVDGDGKVIGVVSEADMMAKEAWAGGHHGWQGRIGAAVHRTERRKAGGVTAGDLMTSPAVTVTADDTVSRAASLMYSRKLKRLPVVDAAGRLVGIVSRVDVLAVFDRLDEEIRVEIVSQVIPRLSEPSYYSVIVKDGVVTVEGSPETVAIGHEVLELIRHVQGVVAVRDHLVYPVPLAVVPGPYITRDGSGWD